MDKPKQVTGCGGCKAKRQITTTLMDRIRRTNLANMANIDKSKQGNGSQMPKSDKK